MKKAKILLLLFTSVFIPVFAEDSFVGGKIDELPQNGNAVSITYTYDADEIDSFRVGFSTSPVEDFSTPKLATDDEMVIPPGSFTATLSKDVYVFWQIATKETVSIYLFPSVMENTTTPEADDLHVNVSTEKIRSNDEGKEINVSTREMNDETTRILTFPGGRCAGSQKVNLVTESLVDKDYGTYLGNLITEIKTQ